LEVINENEKMIWYSGLNFKGSFTPPLGSARPSPLFRRRPRKGEEA